MFRQLLTQTYAQWRKSRLIGTTALAILGALLLVTIYSFTTKTGSAGAKMATITVCAIGCDHTTIQAAIDAASSGDTINVAAGTYNQASGINLNKSIILQGPNAAISPNGGTRVAEAIITGAVNPVLRISLPGNPVTIQGFTFDATGVVDAYDPGLDITIRKNIYSNGTSNGAFYFLNSPPLLTLDDNRLTNPVLADNDAIFVAGNWNGTTGTVATITNNVIENTPADSASGMNLSNVSGTISGNRFMKLRYYAILLANNSSSMTVSNNLFDGIVNPSPGTVPSWGAGVRTYTPSYTGPVNITGNTFQNCYTGVGIRGVPNDPGASIVGMDINVNFNRFINNTYGISDGAAGTFDAENNWWGCNFGPGTGGANCIGTPNGLNTTGTAIIDADPWLTLTFAAAPTTVPAGTNSTLTAKLVINSSGTDTSPMSMFVPNTTPVNFAGVSGTVAPMSTTTTNGVANSTYTASGTLGGGSASTNVDGQTVSQALTIVVGPAAKVVFVQQPTTTPPNLSITPAVTVKLQDAFDHDVLQAGVSITTAHSSGTGSLSGTLTQMTNASGLATFYNLSIDQSGMKQLTAMSIGLTSAASNTFTILSPPAIVYVDDNWVGTIPGADPDGAGPATVFGYNSYATVQGGINGVAATGGTVNVAGGNYTENVTLNKSLTLLGAQAGINACGRSATESIITAVSGTLLTLQTGSAGSIINGLTFSGGARGIESGSGPLDNLQISNNRFAGFTGAGVFLNDTGVDITVHQNEMDGTSKTSGGGSVHLDTDAFDGFHFTSNCVKNAAMGPGLFSDGNRNVGLSASRAPLFDGNVFENHTTNVGVNIGSRSIEDATFSNNIFRNNAFDGLQGGPLRTTFSGNSFVNNGRFGLVMTSFGNQTAGRGSSFVTIKGNLISGNGFTMAGGAGLQFSAQPDNQATNHANFNRIVGNATGVINLDTDPIDVENNWWGCNFGPGTGGAGCSGTPNALGGTGVATIDANPWLVLGITAAPNTIGVGGMSNLTADLTFNSASLDTSGTGNIPNGTPATFAGTLGTVAPPSSTTTSGKAPSIYTGTTGGLGSASTTVDLQTVSTPITITQAPTITCPNNIVRSTDSGQCTAVVTFSVTATGNPAPTVTCNPASGSVFQKGTTTVSCTATNGMIPDGACSFTVTVNDTQAPTITCPANIFLTTTGNPIPATWTTPTASDNCPGVTTSCTPASGSNFAVGVTTVTCTATDTANNTASCSFTVTVNRIAINLADPLGCNGPGGALSGSFTLTNNGNANASATASVALSPGLVAVTGSCAANVGACTINSGSSIGWSGTLAAGQTATVSYQVQIGDAPTGTQLCSAITASFAGGPSATAGACTTVNCPVSGPGFLASQRTELSGQKPGSVLIYNIYTSSTDPTRQNTRINITNVHPQVAAFVHMFFVAEGCSVADSYICLTANQTASFLASDMDPGVSGYLVAVAVNSIGCPANFNYLIGDEYVKFASGHAANFEALAFAAIAGGLPACDQNSVTAALAFDGLSYNMTPRTLALSNVGSRADGNDTLLILNRIGGNLGIGASTLGTLFGILYDDAENSLSFSVTGNCQLRGSLSNNFPRTAPRYESFIPAGRTGWLKIFSQSDVGITGSAINFNPNSASSAGAFNQGHNLHVLTLSSAASYIIPVFPPSC